MTSAINSLLAGVVLVGASAALLVHDPVPADEVSTICQPGYARSQRIGPADYYPIARAAYDRAGIPWSERGGYRLDHRVPLCLGGTWDRSNLEIQTIADAAEKDRLEWRACERVCRGQLSIGTARGWFRDWRAAYRQQFGVKP